MASGIHEPDFRLGIDFGTSHTTAILRWPDGHTRPILFDGSPLLPSAVYADADGRLLVGRDAIHAARLDPARFEPTPKRRIAQDPTGGSGAAGVTEMVAAVLSRVRDEAERVSGVRVDEIGVTLTHPAGWDTDRIEVLREANRAAGLGEARLIPEPVAAAGYFVSVLGRSIPAGSALVVYDFGGGTFDASVVVPNDGGYEVLAVGGLDDVGGVDLDAALLKHVADANRAIDPDAWARLEQPRTAADRRHRRHLIEDVRAAKEMLSRAVSATVPVPLLELEARITREDFDTLARPYLERTVATTGEVITDSGARVAAVLLVGGSSRIPLVTELLAQGTGIAPAAIDQPETVVAEGSIRLAQGGSGLTRASSALPVPPERGSAAPSPAAPSSAAPLSAAPSSAAPLSAAPSSAAPRPTGSVSPVDAKNPAGAEPAAEPTTQVNHLVGAPVDPWAGSEETTPVIAIPLLPPTRAYLPPPQRPPTAQSQPYQDQPRQGQPYQDQGQPYQDQPRQGQPRQGQGRPHQATHVPTTVGLPPPRPRVETAVAYQRYQPRRRRRWPAAVGAVVLVAAVATATVVALPYLNGDGGPGSGRTSPAASQRTAYQRIDPPSWVPQGWGKFADDAAAAVVVDGTANNGGTCTYTGTGVLRVVRDTYDVSGCTMTDAVKDNVLTAVAVEAEFSVLVGCGGMWVRTGARGYFLAVCADGRVELHELGNDPPSDATRIGGPWQPDVDRNRVVVGLLAENTHLEVIINGVPQQIVVDDSIGTGRVGVGGFAPHPANAMDATIGRFRAWAPGR